MLEQSIDNFLHNLFKPLLLFFYLGFLIRLLKVPFEFPYAVYKGLIIYLLISIGWHGGEELACGRWRRGDARLDLRQVIILDGW